MQFHICPEISQIVLKLAQPDPVSETLKLKQLRLQLVQVYSPHWIVTQRKIKLIAVAQHDPASQSGANRQSDGQTDGQTDGQNGRTDEWIK